MKSLFDLQSRSEIVRRMRSIGPESPRRWGRMDVTQMVAHMTDQMHHTLGDYPCAPVPGLLSIPPVKWLAIYVVPWPKGRVKGPPGAFLRKPGAWDEDIAELIGLVERFGVRDPAGSWPDHALFGPMTGRDWGVFCYKHQNHHLRQFGA